MSKEMIISLNGREKKIAILDNGRVSEFYIERGEENSGIVGNIYKGRVQRVLPGMQSAFVEIGLERDAFLYVSDFFDEEEEIERIVMEKSKKASPEEAAREATDQIQRARLEREKQIEAAQEIAEPLAETNTENFEFPEIVEDKEVSNFTKITDAAGEEAIVKEQPKGRRDRSRRGGSTSRELQNERPGDEEKQSVGELFPSEENRKDTEERMKESSPIFEIEDSGFERIVDDEETTGDMFKDAYMQEAIIDKVRAVEFDMEGASMAEVGSLFDSATASAPSSFERIADDDETPEIQPQQVTKTRGSGRGGRNRNSRDGRNAKVENAPRTETAQSQNQSSEDKSEQNKAEKPRASKSRKSTAKSSQENAEESSSDTQTASQTAAQTNRKKNRGGKKTAKAETLGDAEASVRETGDISEMAVRRGGRGRRRSVGGDNRPSGQYTKTDGQASSDGEQENTASEHQAGTNSGGSNGKAGIVNNRRDSRPPRVPQPTISDLLREGQEILVQIAKEPIAKKGARITSHIALPGRFLVYMPTIEHLGVSRKIESSNERARLRTLIQKIKQEEDVPTGGFIVRTAGIGISEQDLRDDARYLVRTWQDIKKTADKAKSPAVVHQDLDIVQRLLRDQLSEEFTAIRVDSEEEYLRTVEFVNRIQPRMVNRVKLYTRDESILEAYGIQEEIDKALKPRVWLKSGGYLVINQTEALVAIDVNTGKFVGRGGNRLEDTITKTNMEAVDEIARQIRLRDLGGIIVLDLIDMEDRRNRNKVAQALQEALASDKSPNKVLSFNDFGLIIMTRKRVKQSLERTMCAPCDYCEGAGWVKSPQTVCFEILEESRRLAKSVDDVRQTTLRVHPDVARALHESENLVLEEIEAYLGNIDVTSDASVHLEQFDFAFI
jgi:ribonuclease G